MLCNYILKRDFELDREFCAEGELDQEKIADFLEKLLHFIERTKSIEHFKLTVDIFRKWKMWLMSTYGVIFEKDIKKAYKDFEEHNPAYEVKTKKKKDKNLSLDFGSIIKNFTKLIIPFSFSSSSNLNSLDSALLSKYTSLRLCSDAEEDFKKSQLISSHNKLKAVLSLLKTEENGLDCLNLYTHAWCTHLLGNILAFQGKYSSAIKQYEISLNTKGKIQDLPEINIIATEAKLEMVKLNSPQESNSVRKLTKLLASITKKEKSLKSLNPDWYDNIVGNVYYYLGAGYFCYSNFEKAKECAKQSIKKGKLLNDHIGVLRSYILLGGFTSRKKNVLKNIEKVVSFLTEEQKSHPYIKKMVCDNWLDEMEFNYDKSFMEKYVRILKGNGIKAFLGKEVNF